MKSLCIYILLFMITAGCNLNQVNPKISVLLLSGSNNHNWQETTLLLKQILDKAKIFQVEITNNPDTLKFIDLKRVDIILNNWNSWPENDVRWPRELEKALMKFIEEGGGFVTFHASSSVFYTWPEFKNISTGAWIMDSTWHGAISQTRVSFTNRQHPITYGMTGFYISDELWVNAERNETFFVLAEANNDDIREKGLTGQPVVQVKEYGKGRIFHTSLGHDGRAIRNSGFKALFLRGTEWAATGNVIQRIPNSVKLLPENSRLQWLETDTTVALLNQDETIWQYNFRSYLGKPFFHPVNIGRNMLTCLSPDDHVWHVGQWFSWKFINGVNYWEYINGSRESEGITEIVDFKSVLYDYFSAELEMEIAYHPINRENVLSEKRKIIVSAPEPNGKISMDYHFEFAPVSDSVVLDRTPILGEPNGQSWGGYGGLSIRFSQDFSDPEFISSWGENDSINGQNGNWLYMGFSGIDGERIGSQIMIQPGTVREGSAWYSVNTEEQPFYYFSPAYLYFKPLTLKYGEKLVLDYRIVHWPYPADSALLGKEYQKYINQ